MTGATDWVRVYGGAPDPGFRLICLPHAGSAASTYASWRLPADLAGEVWAVQLPGRENRRAESPARRVAAVVEPLAEELAACMDRPFALFGHSMGALLAFELARRLRRIEARQPIHLFLSGFRAPDLPAWRPAVSTLPEDAFLARLAEMAGPSSLTVRDPELIRYLMPMMRADFELCESYVYTERQPLPVPLTCFAAVDDPEVRVDEVASWWRHTAMDCAVHTFTGGHLYLLEHAPSVLAHIAEDLYAHRS